MVTMMRLAAKKERGFYAKAAGGAKRRNPVRLQGKRPFKAPMRLRILPPFMLFIMRCMS